MNVELAQPLYKVHCNRDIIFKKYNRQISELVRLDFNIDLLPKEKGNVYCDKTGNTTADILYIDMSSTEFTVYNEDLTSGLMEGKPSFYELCLQCITRKEK